MRKASRYLTWMAAIAMALGWYCGWDQLDAFRFQSDRTFRNISGLAVAGIILFQWGLTLGRTVFQRNGSQWGGWINWHLRSAIVMPLAVLVHSISLGWGLLALLPITLLATAHFGSLLEGEAAIRKHLKYHIALSAVTLALTVVHAWTVLVFN